MTFKPFNARDVDPAKNVYQCAPAGKEYKLIVSKVDFRPTKSGDGAGLNLQIEIVDGDHIGKKIFSWLNVEHKSEKAQQIGQGELSALCRAVNVLDLTDPIQLLDIPFYGDLGIKQDQKGDDVNFLKFGTVKSIKEGKVDRATKVNKSISDKYSAEGSGESW